MISSYWFSPFNAYSTITASIVIFQYSRREEFWAAGFTHTFTDIRFQWRSRTKFQDGAKEGGLGNKSPK